MKLQNLVMQLRKVCNHPYIFHQNEEDEDEDGEKLITSCGKMMLLDRLLSALISRGHKVLIFSQMTKMLDILEDYCNIRGHPFCRIDGGVNYASRAEQVWFCFFFPYFLFF
jgi:SNF2 family DNA or RNA helicase